MKKVTKQACNFFWYSYIIFSESSIFLYMYISYIKVCTFSIDIVYFRTELIGM